MAKRKVPTTKAPKPHTDQSALESCFIIMPFGNWFDEYYRTIFIPAIDMAGLKPVRADDLYRPSAIVHDIWEMTKQAKIILADLSEKNPNVFYELGLAHALAKPAILVSETIENIPFDLRALRVIIYDKNKPDWGENLRNNISQSIREILQSPQEAVLPAFLKVTDSINVPPVSKTEKELIAIKQDVELLKREVRSRAEIGYQPLQPSGSLFGLSGESVLSPPFSVPAHSTVIPLTFGNPTIPQSELSPLLSTSPTLKK